MQTTVSKKIRVQHAAADEGRWRAQMRAERKYRGSPPDLIGVEVCRHERHASGHKTSLAKANQHARGEKPGKRIGEGAKRRCDAPNRDAKCNHYPPAMTVSEATEWDRRQNIEDYEA